MLLEVESITVAYGGLVAVEDDEALGVDVGTGDVGDGDGVGAGAAKGDVLEAAREDAGALHREVGG